MGGVGDEEETGRREKERVQLARRGDVAELDNLQDPLKERERERERER